MTKKRLINSTLLAGASLLALAVAAQPAMAMNLPGPIKIDGGPLGQLEVSGGLSAQMYTYSGSGVNGLYGSDSSSGGQLRTIDLTIAKTSGPLQFTVEVKPNDSLYLGMRPGGVSANTFTTGPLYLGYVTLAPSPNFSISVGQVGSVEGWESSTDWNNANIVDSPLYYVENSSSRGVSATYTMGPVSATVVFGDGFDTGVFNTMQGLVTYTFNSNNALSLYGEVNFGATGGNTRIYGGGPADQYGPYGGTYYANSNMIGGYYDFTYGNLNVIPEVQYVYAKVDHKLGLDKFGSNFGAEVLTDYQFGKTPWSVGGQVFYYSNNGPEYWYLNPRSAGIGLGVTPSYAKGSFFARGELAMLHLTNIGDGPAFGSGGTNRNTVLAVLEGGFVF